MAKKKWKKQKRKTFRCPSVGDRLNLHKERIQFSHNTEWGCSLLYKYRIKSILLIKKKMCGTVWYATICIKRVGEIIWTYMPVWILNIFGRILKIPLIAFGQLRSRTRGKSLIIYLFFFYLSSLESYEFITFTIFLRSVGMNHLPSQNKI